MSGIEWTALQGRRLGVMKTAAARLGLTLAEYRVRLDAGQRWCTACKEWHEAAAFDVDESRGLGLKAMCKQVCRVRNRGRRREPTKERARAAVQLAIRRGDIKPANAMPCTDCGHSWSPGDLRHEYDHHRGYAPEDRLSVEAVCTPCHRKREPARE